MCFGCTIKYSVASAGLLVSAPVMTLGNSVRPTDYSAAREVVNSIRLPRIDQPAWMKRQLHKAAPISSPAPTAGSSRPVSRTVTYSVETRGAITANVAEFKQQANQTLNDSHGWRRMGVAFQQVQSGGMFTLVLAQANELPKFSPGCDSGFSCRAGRYVIINQDRWLGATGPWTAAGGSLRDYRHMVVNHETGHWLGHGHQMCSGGKAAVMQQQSMSLQGCSTNPWPLDSELWSTQLGIAR